MIRKVVFAMRSESNFSMSDDEMTRLFQEAVKLEIQKNKIMRLPINGYDTALKRSYIEYPDGRREYAK